MSLPNDDKCEKGVQTMTRTKKFSKLFCELEGCREVEQMQKIEEMYGLIDEMNEKEFQTVFTKEQFNKIHQMIEKNTLSLENAILLLKHVGYCKELKMIFLYSFDDSSLSKKMREMMIDENKKKNDEKHLIDLFECYLLLSRWPSSEMDSIIVPCLLKVASKKEENEKSQNEVEMALLALSNANTYYEIKKEIFKNEIKEIMKYHQEHHNLTQLAYQSAWQFLFYRLIGDKSLEGMIAVELHFAREARREIEELARCIDWKRKEERGKEAKEVIVIWRWIYAIDNYLTWCTLWSEELSGLLGSIVRVIRASRDNHPDISHECIFTLRNASDKKKKEIDAFAKKGIIDVFLEEMNQSTLDDGILWNCLLFFLNISERLNEKKDDEDEKGKRKEMKRKIFEKMEEEGYEDIISSLFKFICFVYERINVFSKYLTDYFVYIL